MRKPRPVPGVAPEAQLEIAMGAVLYVLDGVRRELEAKGHGPAAGIVQETMKQFIRDATMASQDVATRVVLAMKE